MRPEGADSTCTHDAADAPIFFFFFFPFLGPDQIHPRGSFTLRAARLCVITGKGPSCATKARPLFPVRHGVLPPSVPQWLSMPAAVVCGASGQFRPHISHGQVGGAYYVYLRRHGNDP